MERLIGILEQLDYEKLVPVCTYNPIQKVLWGKRAPHSDVFEISGMANYGKCRAGWRRQPGFDKAA